MLPRTEKLWAKQNQHEGDRLRLFSAVADAIEGTAVLYPGSFVDVAPSFVFASVTYVDMDKRAAQFFADTEGVEEIIATHRLDDERRITSFVGADYRTALDLPLASFDLLVSLYAGFISEYCTQFLRIGGSLLVNASHGDAAMASIDPRYELSAVVLSSGGNYTVRNDDLETYLVPKKPQSLTVEALHDLGKGIAYTRPAFAYLFTRVS